MKVTKVKTLFEKLTLVMIHKILTKNVFFAKIKEQLNIF
jgi:hypothetical protein